MDIQGSEIDLINGSKETIKNIKPIIFVEASVTECKNAGKSIYELWNLLKDMDYEIYLINKCNLILLKEYDLVKEGNWLCFPISRN